MKINLVSGATYYPARVGQKSNVEAGRPVDRKTQPLQASRFEKLLLEKLSPGEATAISKLFGEFKIDSAGDLKPGGSTSGDKTGSVPRGKFVDIII